MKTLTIQVTYTAEISIDESNWIVKEYKNEKELLIDCATYHFGSVLPVIGDGGVQLVDISVTNLNVL